MARPSDFLRMHNFDFSAPDDEVLYYERRDESTQERAEKRRRIEAHARRYLRGEDLHIQTASLKGPFDNWENPWRSNGVAICPKPVVIAEPLPVALSEPVPVAMSEPTPIAEVPAPRKVARKRAPVKVKAPAKRKPPGKRQKRDVDKTTVEPARATRRRPPPRPAKREGGEECPDVEEDPKRKAVSSWLRRVPDEPLKPDAVEDDPIEDDSMVAMHTPSKCRLSDAEVPRQLPLQPFKLKQHRKYNECRSDQSPLYQYIPGSDAGPRSMRIVESKPKLEPKPEPEIPVPNLRQTIEVYHSFQDEQRKAVEHIHRTPKARQKKGRFVTFDTPQAVVPASTLAKSEDVIARDDNESACDAGETVPDVPTAAALEKISSSSAAPVAEQPLPPPLPQPDRPPASTNDKPSHHSSGTTVPDVFHSLEDPIPPLEANPQAPTLDNNTALDVPTVSGPSLPEHQDSKAYSPFTFDLNTQALVDAQRDFHGQFADPVVAPVSPEAASSSPALTRRSLFAPFKRLDASQPRKSIATDTQDILAAGMAFSRAAVPPPKKRKSAKGAVQTLAFNFPISKPSAAGADASDENKAPVPGSGFAHSEPADPKTSSQPPLRSPLLKKRSSLKQLSSLAHSNSQPSPPIPSLGNHAPLPGSPPSVVSPVVSLPVVVSLPSAAPGSTGDSAVHPPPSYQMGQELEFGLDLEASLDEFSQFLAVEF